MALIKCHECGNEVSTEAAICPKCGATPKNKTNTVKAVMGTLVALGFAWFFLGGGLEKQAASEMAHIQDQVATDAVAQYEIAKRQGDPIQVCVQAGMVAAAYLQAKDDANFNAWKSTEKADCTRAGIPK